MGSHQVNYMACQVTSGREANEAGKGDGGRRVNMCRLNRMLGKRQDRDDSNGAKACGR